MRILTLNNVCLLYTFIIGKRYKLGFKNKSDKVRNILAQNYDKTNLAKTVCFLSKK
jgi:hypothetical protein